MIVLVEIKIKFENIAEDDRQMIKLHSYVNIDFTELS